MYSSQGYASVSFYDRERAAGTMLVDMDSEGALKASGNKRDSIATFGLCGCTAIAVVMQLPNVPSSRVAVVAHYSSLAMHARAYNRLRALLQQHWAEGIEVKAYIVTPGKYGTHPVTGKPYSLLPNDDLTVNLYTSVLRVDLPSLEEVAVHAYSENRMAGATEQGTVLVQFSARDETVRVLIEGIPA